MLCGQLVLGVARWFTPSAAYTSRSLSALSLSQFYPLDKGLNIALVAVPGFPIANPG